MLQHKSNLYVNISGRSNEMNISTSFICFHFILLIYWFLLLGRSAFYDIADGSFVSIVFD